MEIETAILGQELTTEELKTRYKQIYGGVAWPGKRPGFAVVIGMDHERHLDNHNIYLLDEFESSDTREIVRQCSALDYKYQPARWIGDTRNDAADRFITEIKRELHSVENSREHRRYFSVSSTLMLDMKHPFQYILPELKRLLDKDRRQLFLKDSQVINYLSEIDPSEIPTLEFGDFPAIEALAFAVIDMRLYGSQRRKSSRRNTRPKSPMAM